MKKIITLLLSLCLIATACFVVGCGNSTTSIKTKEDLLNVGLTGDYLLENDIDLGGAEWSPIGTKESPFNGTFDGNGFTVKNFKITGNAVSGGVFAFNNGTVKNLTVKNATINANFDFVGGIVGVNFGSVLDCEVESDITCLGSKTNNKDVLVGGIVGDGADGKIEGCSYFGTIVGKSVKNNVYVGGIVGKGSSLISTCKVSGKVKASTYDYEDPDDIVLNNFEFATFVGGIVGASIENAKIEKCENKATVESESVASAYAGGITAENQADVINCDNQGSVRAYSKTKGQPTFNVGGLVGTMTKGNINYSVNSGDVYGFAENLSENQKSFSVCSGGLVGLFINGYIKNNLNFAQKVMMVITGERLSTGGKQLTGWIINSDDWGASANIVNCYFDRFTTTVIKNDDGLDNQRDFATHYTGDGTNKAMADILTVDFLTGATNLNFDSDIWNISNGKIPTLK